MGLEALEHTDSPQVSVPLVGRGFVYVGLVLANLLAPQGPVDPVEKAALKLAHIQTEVRNLMQH